MNHRARLAGPLALLLSALLGACASAPPPARPGSPGDLAAQAQSQGQYQAAARLWLDAAAMAGPPQSDQFQLRAAEAWLAAGQRQNAYLSLQAIDMRRLGAADRSRFALIKAEQALINADAETASNYLELARSGLERDQEYRFLNIENSIIRLRTDPANELLARISRMLASIDPSDPDQGAGLLRQLEPIPSGQLAAAAQAAGERSLAGSWAELALRIRRGLVAANGTEQEAAAWASDFPDHSVSRETFLGLAESYGERFQAPARVGVLLPMRGGLASAGLAIRDGLLNAFLNHPENSQLQFYDSGDSPGAALSAYQQALDDGAQWIIGPVRRESVEAIIHRGAATVPILALNDSDSTGEPVPTGSLYRLSLSQEEEARSVARQMLASGSHAAITLATDNARGHRMEQAFAEAFLAGGGVITAMAYFPASESDHSAELTRILQIDQSISRKDRLQSLLGVSLAFEPHLREDFDAFFLSSDPEQARQLRPQLRFFEAGDKPIFAASRAYSGLGDRDADQDLNGVVLPLTRAQLLAIETGTLPGLDSLRGGRLHSLYALGEDAWNLLAWLPLLETDPDLAFSGQVGALKLGEDGKLFREPSWAVISNGRPVAMQWPKSDE
jgi:outer membrane PBP1 activator LpoA protein